MKTFSMALIVFAGMGFLFSMFFSAFGVSLACLAIVAVYSISIRNKSQKKFFRKKISLFALPFSVFLIFFYGCTIKVPMKPDCRNIEYKEKFPVEAGLLITKEGQEYVFNGKPESFTAGGRPHEFPLGKALMTSSELIFAELFESVKLVDNLEEAQNYKLIVRPEIEEFHFRYDQLSYAGFAVSVLSRIKVTVTLFSGESKLWEKTIESHDVRKGPWFINAAYEKEVGESASEALVFTLNQIALEISENDTLREYLLGEVEQFIMPKHASESLGDEVRAQDSNTSKMSTRASQETANKENLQEPWSGMWKVEASLYGGIWCMKQRGKIVNSTKDSLFEFKGNVMENRLKGRMINSGLVFPFVIKISLDGMSFEGNMKGVEVNHFLKGTRME